MLMAFAFPVLTVARTWLTLDRYLGMHFFTNALAGLTAAQPELTSLSIKSDTSGQPQAR
jgi:hypothetical protein